MFAFINIMSIDDFNPYVAEDEEWVYCAVNSSLVEKVDRGLWDEYGNIREVVLAQTEDFRLYNTDIKTERHGRPYSVLISLQRFFQAYLSFKRTYITPAHGWYGRVDKNRIYSTRYSVDREEFIFTFLLKYFSKYAVDRYIREERLPRISRHLAFNSRCPEVLLVDAFVKIFKVPLRPQLIKEFATSMPADFHQTAYFKVGVFRAFVNQHIILSQMNDETKELWRETLSVLRLHYLLKEINTFHFQDAKGIQLFKFLIKQHHHEQEREYIFPGTTDYGNAPHWRVPQLRSLLYYYPKFINDFYKRMCARPKRISVRSPGIDLVLNDVIGFYSNYYFPKNGKH